MSKGRSFTSHFLSFLLFSLSSLLFLLLQDETSVDAAAAAAAGAGDSSSSSSSSSTTTQRINSETPKYATYGGSKNKAKRVDAQTGEALQKDYTIVCIVLAVLAAFYFVVSHILKVCVCVWV